MTAQQPITVMVFARLFQGLGDSLAEKRWRPGGVPAIYKLLEALAADPSIRLVTVFGAKDPHDPRFSRTEAFDLAPLGRVHILPQKRWPLLRRLRLSNKWREIRHLVQCLWLYRRHRPAVAYFTNAHFVPAGIIARFGRCRSVFRFLGVTPAQHRIARGDQPVARWFYRAPFDQVICTLDGSGGTHYLPKLLRAGVPYRVLINGADRPQADGAAHDRVASRLPADGIPLVLFVGKLEAQKGCHEFVEAAIDLASRRPGGFRALLLGDGVERGALERRVATAGLEDVVLLPGGVPHGEVAAWLARADIYASINKLGNVSNANLEAAIAGKCMIVLDKDPVSHIDEETEDIWPTDAVLRIPRIDIPRNLATTLEGLLDRPQEIERRGALTRRLTEDLVQDWPMRTATEVSLLLGKEGSTPDG